MSGRVINLIKESCPDYVWFSSWEIFMIIDFVDEEKRGGEYYNYESLKVILRRMVKLGMLETKKPKFPQYVYRDARKVNGKVRYVYKVKSCTKS